MKKVIGAFLLGAALCLAFTTMASPAAAQETTVKQSVKKNAKHHSKKKKKKYVKAKYTDRTRKAQAWLITLGYNPGPVDGVMGSQTEAALIVFQRDHDLSSQSGLLDKETYERLEKEATAPKPVPELPVAAVAPPPQFYIDHPDFYGYVGSDYADPNQLASPQAIPTRFGTMQISMTQTGVTRLYSVTLNGQEVFHAEGQASALNVSRTFNGKEVDAVILTAYNAGDATCPYRHTLLTVRENSNGVFDITNCTRDYKAYTENGSLYVYFPGDHVDGWSSGQMWRYEHGTLEKL